MIDMWRVSTRQGSRLVLDSVERAIFDNNLVVASSSPAPTDFLFLDDEYYIGNDSVKLDDYRIKAERLRYAFSSKRSWSVRLSSHRTPAEMNVGVTPNPIILNQTANLIIPQTLHRPHPDWLR